MESKAHFSRLLPSPQPSPTGRGSISAVLPAPVCARKRVSPDTKQVLMGAGGGCLFALRPCICGRYPLPSPPPLRALARPAGEGVIGGRRCNGCRNPRRSAPSPARRSPAAGLEQLVRSARKGWGGGSVADDVTAVSPVHLHTHRALKGMYSHPPKASYGVASPRRTTAYCLRRRALSETFGGWL